MVSLASYPLSSTPPQESGEPPLTIATTHQLWTQALTVTPPSPFISLTRLRRLIRTVNLQPETLLTPTQLSPLYLNIALILAFLGEYFLAAESFQKALELDSKSTIGWHGLAGMNFLLGNWEAARKAWKICSVCFGAREVVKYRVWKIGGNGTEAEVSRDRRWVLDRAKVEWNLRFTSFEKTLELEQQKHQVWDVNGIPAGLVFGPNFSAAAKKLYYEKEIDGFWKETVEAKAYIPPHASTNQPLGSTRASSPKPKLCTKPLPALPLPVRTTSTPLPAHRAQKGLSISRLFSKPRTSSASKSQALKPKRQELLGEPFSRYDNTDCSPIFESNLFRDGFGNGKTHGLGVIVIPTTTTTELDLIPNVFDTDSDSNEDAAALSYYFDPSTAQASEEKCIARPAATKSASPQLFPPRTSSHNAARIDTPRMESRRQDISSPTRAEKGKEVITRTRKTEVGNLFQDMKRNEFSTKVENNGSIRMAAEINEKKRSGATHEMNSKSGTEEMRSQKGEVRGRSETKYITVDSRARNKQIEEDSAFVKKEVAKLEQAKLEPAKPQPLRAYLEKPEPVKQERVKQQPTETKSAKPDSVRLEPAKAERVKQQPAKPQSTKPERAKLEPAKSERVKQQPAELKPAKLQPTKPEPGRLAPAKAERAKQQPAESKPAKAEPTKPERAKQPQAELWPAALRPAKFHPANAEPIKREPPTTLPPVVLQPTKPELPKPHPAGRLPEYLHPALAGASQQQQQVPQHLDSTLEYLKPLRFEGFDGEWRAADIAWEETLQMRALKKATQEAL